MKHNQATSSTTKAKHHSKTPNDEYLAESSFEDSEIDLKGDEMDIEVDDFKLHSDKSTGCGCGCRTHHNGY